MSQVDVTIERKASKWRAVAGPDPFAKVWLQYECGGVKWGSDEGIGGVGAGRAVGVHVAGR